jgi:hypothetical protein
MMSVSPVSRSVTWLMAGRVGAKNEWRRWTLLAVLAVFVVLVGLANGVATIVELAPFQTAAVTVESVHSTRAGDVVVSGVTKSGRGVEVATESDGPSDFTPGQELRTFKLRNGRYVAATRLANLDGSLVALGAGLAMLGVAAWKRSLTFNVVSLKPSSVKSGRKP